MYRELPSSLQLLPWTHERSQLKFCVNKTNYLNQFGAKYQSENQQALKNRDRLSLHQGFIALQICNLNTKTPNLHQNVNKLIINFNKKNISGLQNDLQI